VNYGDEAVVKPMRKLLTIFFTALVVAYIIGCGTGKGPLGEELDKNSEVKIKDMQNFMQWVSGAPKPPIDVWNNKFSTHFEHRKIRWRGVIVREGKGFFYMKVQDLTVQFQATKPIEVGAMIEVFGRITGFQTGGREVFIDHAEWIAVE